MRASEIANLVGGMRKRNINNDGSFYFLPRMLPARSRTHQRIQYPALIPECLIL